MYYEVSPAQLVCTDMLNLHRISLETAFWTCAAAENGVEAFEWHRRRRWQLGIWLWFRRDDAAAGYVSDVNVNGFFLEPPLKSLFFLVSSMFTINLHICFRLLKWSHVSLSDKYWDQVKNTVPYGLRSMLPNHKHMYFCQSFYSTSIISHLAWLIMFEALGPWFQSEGVKSQLHIFGLKQLILLSNITVLANLAALQYSSSLSYKLMLAPLIGFSFLQICSNNLITSRIHMRLAALRWNNACRDQLKPCVLTENAAVSLIARTWPECLCFPCPHSAGKGGKGENKHMKFATRNCFILIKRS